MPLGPLSDDEHELLESAGHDDADAIALLRKLPSSSQLRQAFYRQRADRVFKLFEQEIRDAYGLILASCRDEIPDALQEFWLRLASGTAANLNFDGARPEGRYIFGVARTCALNYRTRKLRHRQVELHDSIERALQSPAPHFLREHSWVIRHVEHLVATNELHVPQAMVLLCKAVAGLGATQLAASHSDFTLWRLMDLLETSPEGTDPSLTNLWQALRSQLDMPVGYPSGSLTLAEMARSEGDSDLAVALQGWKNDALRTCRRHFDGISWTKAKPIHDEVASNYRAGLASRLAFLDRSLRRGTPPVHAILWAWRHMFRTPTDDITHYTCLGAARELERRVRARGVGGGVAADFGELLGGPEPDRDIGEFIDAGVDQAIRNMEDRYRRAVAERHSS
jgi:hypothetical protein